MNKMLYSDRHDSNQAPIGSLAYPDLKTLIEKCLYSMQAKFGYLPGVRFVLTAPVDMTLPVAIRAEVETLELIVSSLIEQAVDNLGGGEGIIRLSLQPFLGYVSFSVEDNGRGFGEHMLLRQQSQPEFGISDVVEKAGRFGIRQLRYLVELDGGRFVFNARLGVGTRITAEFLRVDAFANLTRAVTRKPQEAMSTYIVQ